VGRLTALVAELSPHKGPRCGVAMLLEQLDRETADELRELLDNRAIYATTISRALEQLNHKVSTDALRHHRLRECTCPR
jgi:hypothetical protein